MIAAHCGELIAARPKKDRFWAFFNSNSPSLTWNWEAFDYEVAPGTEPGTTSPKATAAALPPLTQGGRFRVWEL